MAQDRAESNYDANREMPLWVITDIQMLIGYVCFRAKSGPRDESGLKVRQVPIADLGLS